MIKKAIISPCERYRYYLERNWSGVECPPVSDCVGAIMLNPSKADHLIDDPTIIKDIFFAKKFGYKLLGVGNIFGLRSTDPRYLKTDKNPVGYDNATYLKKLIEKSDKIILAWGSNDFAMPFAEQFLEDFSDYSDKFYQLGEKTNKNGSPKHPLYLPHSTDLFKFEGLK